MNEHPAIETESVVCRQNEFERILSWRCEELERAGYGVEAAIMIAADPEVDLHFAVDLVRKGCPPETAMRIL